MLISIIAREIASRRRTRSRREECPRNFASISATANYVKLKRSMENLEMRMVWADAANICPFSKFLDIETERISLEIIS